MIFITLGSQKFQFNRLLKEIDYLIENKIITEPVFAQIGYSTYKPANYRFTKFLDRNAFISFMSKADIVITHGGTGAIINAVKQDKKVIAVPRLAKYNEHVDNHQCEIIHQFESMGLICGCDEVGNLSNSLNIIRNINFRVYESNTDKIIESILEFIEK